MPPVKKPLRIRQKTFLKEWREFRGYSQEQAAEMAQMSRENLGKIERGKVPYNQDVLELLAEAYNCEIADLLIRNPLETENIWTIWSQAKQSSRNAIISFAKTLEQVDASFITADETITLMEAKGVTDRISREKLIAIFMSFAGIPRSEAHIAERMGNDELIFRIKGALEYKMNQITADQKQTEQPQADAPRKAVS